jgi:hypothetical protein
MLKFENTAEVGDRIRSYDFEPIPGRTDCFIEGTVIDKGYHPTEGYKCFTVVCDFESVSCADSNYSRISRNVYVPMGCSFMEYDTRVTKV